MCIHVDEFLCQASTKLLLNTLHQQLIKEYNEVTIKSGDMLAYLGIQIQRFSDGSIKISQPGYCEKLVKQHLSESELKFADTPMPTVFTKEPQLRLRFQI
jgi:hypothetical protein